ncbi:MAG: hypothetical protein ACYSU0_20890 [Planctomycetota bacterium]|jgi:hypothetical protein
MFRRSVAWTVGVGLAAALVAGGCGDDDDAAVGGGTPVEANGHWKCIIPSVGVYLPACLEQTGDAVSGILADFAVTGTASGNTLTVINGDPVSGDYGTMIGTTNGPDLISGTFTNYVAHVPVASGPVDFARYVPSGQFTASGTLSGNAINVDTTTDGTGEIVGAGGVATGLQVFYMSTTRGLRFRVISTVDKIAVGTFTVVTSPSAADEIDVEFFDATPAYRVNIGAESGTVVVSKFDATGITATFTLNFAGGAETVTGSFDVPWDFLTGAPF